MSTYAKVRSLRAKASQLQALGGDHNMAAARRLRDRSNGLVGAILHTQQAVERSFAYQTTLCFPQALVSVVLYRYCLQGR